MEIQLYNHNSVVPFTENDHAILRAVESRLVNDVSDDELRAKLLILIRNAHLLAEIKAPENKIELDIRVNEIINEQRRNKTNIRIDEIQIAFTNGVHRKYGEYYGLSAISFCMFIREYLKEEMRNEALRIKNAPKQVHKPSDEEIYRISVENCKQAFNELKSKGTVGRFGVVVYDFLTSQNILKLHKEEKKQYWQDAKDDFKAFLEREISIAQDKLSINKLKNDLAFIVSTLEAKTEQEKEGLTYPETTKQKLITISKRLAVDDYFRSLEMENLTLEEVLK